MGKLAKPCQLQFLQKYMLIFHLILLYNHVKNSEGKNMAIPALKINFEKEMEKRRAEAELLQTKLDVEELDRRVKAVEEGHSKLIDADEVWASLEKMGY